MGDVAPKQSKNGEKPKADSRFINLAWHFLPRRLSTFLLSLFAIIFSTATLTFTYAVLQDQSGHTRETMTLQATALAKNVAVTAGNYLLVRNYSSIEQVLLQTIEFPDVTAVQLVDAQGKRLGDVRREADRINTHHGQAPLTLPVTAEPTAVVTSAGLEVWQPVIIGDLVGWVKITSSLAEGKKLQEHLLVKNTLFGSVILVFCLLTLWLLLRRPLKTVALYTDFADRIDEGNGEQLNMHSHINELARLGIVLNLTSRRLHEQKATIAGAMRGLERLAAFPEKSPEVVLSVAADGQLTYLNPHGEQMLADLGLERRDYTSIVPDNHLALIKQCLREHTTSRTIEASYGGRTLLWTYAPVATQQTVHCYAHEITEKKQAEEKAREAILEKRSADAANQSKSAFLANMSHEIRTPLTAIIGFSESLLEDNHSPEERIDALNTVIRAGRHLLQIINEILDISKVEARQLQIEQLPVPLFDLLDDVKTLASLQAEAKGIKLVVEPIYPLPVSIISDPVRFRQILLNLISNAIKFTEVGSVTLRVTLSTVEKQLRIDVIDTGIGIAADKLPSLFKPFSQADSSTTRRFGGTGLGLYLAKQLAEKLGGTITVTSQEGVGTRFTATIATGELDDAILLMSTPKQRSTATAAQKTIYAPTSTVIGSVLLADDNIDNQRLISLYLRNMGATVTIASNGAEAVEHAIAARYDLILMDMQMPVMDGMEATRRLRAAEYSQPIVALTADAMETDFSRAIDAGCDSFLTKPVDRTRFQEVVCRHLRPRLINESDEPLESSLMGEDNALTDLVVQFVKHFPALVADIATTVRNQDWQLTRDKAHDLKSVGGSYGYPQVSEIAAHIEMEIKEQGYERLPPLMRKLRALNTRIQAGAPSALLRGESP